MRTSREVTEGIVTDAVMSGSPNTPKLIRRPDGLSRPTPEEPPRPAEFASVAAFKFDGKPEGPEELGTEILVPCVWNVPHGDLTSTDQALVRQIQQADEQFARLYCEGDASQDQSDYRRAAFTVCYALAEATMGDRRRMDAIFRASALMRPVWDRKRDNQTLGEHILWEAVACARIDPYNPGFRRTIVVSDRQLNAVTNEVIEALKNANDPPQLFVHAGNLSRLGRTEDDKCVITALTDVAVVERMGRAANFFREVRGGFVAARPPRDVAANINARGDWPEFPALKAVVESPVVRQDGTILMRPGYDVESRLFYAPAPGLVMSVVPDNPTREDVAAALALLDDFFGEFPYDSPASRANALGLMLTPLVRPLIPVTPLALIDATQQGSGKSLLSKVVSVLAAGREPAMMTAPTTEEEWRKQITAKLKASANVIAIDNIHGLLKSAALDAALTAPQWSDRELGHTRQLELSNAATWMATGNNLRIGGDLARRCYHIRFDAKDSTPWLGREFRHPELLADVRAARGQLLAALLTLVRSWCAAGRPKPTSPILGSFEEFSITVGGILQHAGISGFLGNLSQTYEAADDESEQWIEFLCAVHATTGDTTFTTKRLAEMLREDASLRASLPASLAGDFDSAGFTKSLGWGLTQRKDRRHGPQQVRVEGAGKTQGANLYVIKMEAAP
jgi:hypothetical protein